MRTLSRPMFNMGGPIKQGIMHGIREPYVKGKIVSGITSRAGPIFQRVGNIFRGAPPKVTPKYPGGTYTGREYIPAPLTKMEQIKNWFGSAPAGQYLAGTPEAGAVKWVWSGKGLIPKAIKGTFKSPTVGAGVTYGAYRGIKGALSGDDTPESGDAPISVPLNPALQELQKKKKATTTENAAAFAKSQREDRLNRYLKLMGYDQSKKTAIADALIDASKIVSDRGTLDRKNITGELINPIIQATSARLDKPQQIREAVGLMMTKGEIEKDLEDPTVKALRMKQLEKLDREASPGISRSIMAYMASKKDDVKGKELVDLVRLAANEEGTPFKFISEEEIAKIPEMEGKTALEIVSSTAEADGVYMIGDAVIEVKGGVPTQIK